VFGRLFGDPETQKVTKCQRQVLQLRANANTNEVIMSEKKLKWQRQRDREGK